MGVQAARALPAGSPQPLARRILCPPLGCRQPLRRHRPPPSPPSSMARLPRRPRRSCSATTWRGGGGPGAGMHGHAGGSPRARILGGGGAAVICSRGSDSRHPLLHVGLATQPFQGRPLPLPSKTFLSGPSTHPQRWFGPILPSLILSKDLKGARSAAQRKLRQKDSQSSRVLRRTRKNSWHAREIENTGQRDTLAPRQNKHEHW